jgi:hypothetical protein
VSGSINIPVISIGCCVVMGKVQGGARGRFCRGSEVSQNTITATTATASDADFIFSNRP